MLSCMGVGDLIGRATTGPIVHFWKRDITILYVVSQFLCALFIGSFLLKAGGIAMISQGCLFSLTYGFQCGTV